MSTHRPLSLKQYNDEVMNVSIELKSKERGTSERSLNIKEMLGSLLYVRVETSI